MSCYYNHHALIDILRLAKFFHEAGLFEKICRGMDRVSEDDFYELCELGLENIAPFFERCDVTTDDEGNWVIMGETEGYEAYEDTHLHTMYRFSSPEMREYYRLCRLYELQQSIEPEENRFVALASDYYSDCLRYVDGNFWAGFDDDKHTSQLIIEFCPENYYGPNVNLIQCIYETLEYYKENLNELRRELLRGPMVFLPALPAQKGDEHHAQS